MRMQMDMPKQFVIQKGKKFFTGIDDSSYAYQYGTFDKAKVMNRESYLCGIGLQPCEKIVAVTGRAGKSLKIKGAS